MPGPLPSTTTTPATARGALPARPAGQTVGGGDPPLLPPHSLQPPLQGAARDAEKLRRTRDVPGRALKSFSQMAICRLFQREEVIGTVARFRALVPLSRSNSPEPSVKLAYPSQSGRTQLGCAPALADSTPHDVEQLPHIPRPALSQELPAHLACHLGPDGVALAGQVKGQVSQQEHVKAPFAEWRQLGWQYPQPIKEIRPKIPQRLRLDCSEDLQLAGRAAPDADRSVRTHRAHDAVVERGKELDLDRFRTVTDVVQEKRFAGLDRVAESP